MQTKALKVYSRDRARRIHNNVAKLERKGVLVEEDIEDMDSSIDGDKLSLLRPDSSSNSSSSISEEEFLSDSATEEAQDTELEGISSLFGNSEFLVDNNQKISEQKVSCELLQPKPTIYILSPIQEGEEENEGDRLLKDDAPIDKTESLKGRDVEWEKVQDILSQLGQHLVPKNKMTNMEGSRNGDRRKKGIRELQNLKFNVNYDHGECSRDMQSSP